MSSEWWEDAGHYAYIPRGSFPAACMRKTHGNNMRSFEQVTFMILDRDHANESGVATQLESFAEAEFYHVLRC